VAVATVSFVPRKPDEIRPFLGFGAQLNVDIFTRADNDFVVKVPGRPDQAQNLTLGQLGHLKEAIKDLKPGHCRVFVQKGLDPETEAGRNAPAFKALMKTIELAEEAGANVNLTWWGQEHYANGPRLKNLSWPHAEIRKWPQGNLSKWPEVLTNREHPQALLEPTEKMRCFALIIAEARRQGFTCVTHATIQNEVNGALTDIARKGKPHLSMRLYEWLYRELDRFLKAIDDPGQPGKKLKESVTVVAGDLIERVGMNAPGSRPNDWLKYMHPNMGVDHHDLVRVADAYSEHIYWDPTEFPAKPRDRLNGIVKTLSDLHCEMPFYVTEYGVRWLVKVVNGVKTDQKLEERKRPGELHGSKMEDSPEAAFQHAWFDALAPQLGCVGLVKWVLYRTDMIYGWGEWGMVDPPSASFRRTASYRMMRLFTHAVGNKWRATGLGDAGVNVMASRFLAPNGDDQTVLVLNKGVQARDVEVTTLRKNRVYHRAIWNRDAAGGLVSLDPERSASDGVLTVTVPQNGVVALSTLPMGL